tara:strand:+ start:200 stop:490 length:291 start_codon:yes stop_codon:yes gene_type:complete
MENFKEINERLQKIEALLLTQKTVLSFDEGSAYTGLSKSHLYKMTSTGGIPCYKPHGKNIYFDKQEIDSWLLQNRKATTEELDNLASTIVTLNKTK